MERRIQRQRKLQRAARKKARTKKGMDIVRGCICRLARWYIWFESSGMMNKFMGGWIEVCD
jgi:hypothetical protein